MNLTTRAVIKEFLEIAEATTTFDALIDSLLVMVSKRFETYCNRSFESLSRTQKFNAGRRHYFLPAYPVSESPAPVITYDGDVQVENDDYYVYYSEGWIEFYLEPVRTEPQQVTITWTGGYTVDNIPQDLQYACMMQVAFVFRRRKDLGVSSVSLPDGSISINSPADLLPEVKHVLKSYRKAPGER
jgi:hypothetical protein